MAVQFSRTLVNSTGEEDVGEMDARLHESLITDLEGLLKDQASTDLEFVVRGGRVKAHKVIVLCRCNKYKSKRTQWCAPEQRVVSVHLETFSVRTVKSVVLYLYTGKVCPASGETIQVESLLQRSTETVLAAGKP